MIRSRGLEDKMRRQRADAKTLDNLFRRRIEAGANCSLFVSQAILQTAKDVFPSTPNSSTASSASGRSSSSSLPLTNQRARPSTPARRSRSG